MAFIAANFQEDLRMPRKQLEAAVDRCQLQNLRDHSARSLHLPQQLRSHCPQGVGV